MFRVLLGVMVVTLAMYLLKKLSRKEAPAEAAAANSVSVSPVTAPVMRRNSSG
ncbi:hypothetical protein TSUD_283580 [Trifolium subterraneum]|uniref:Uncharacterized protein n=1 Tax=Trifolium subterraneum TaxID=3900 RepID=A0A2Z6NE99_TRISU|nr:hypothetical protein TSUD_283580 [Trifolium subterraneum]